MKRMVLFLLFAGLFTGKAVFAQSFQDIYNVFLLKLVERHEELGTLTMPEVEIKTVPGYDDEAVYITSFKTPEEAQTFAETLREEDIPFGITTGKEHQLILFYSDLIVFIMKAVIGL